MKKEFYREFQMLGPENMWYNCADAMLVLAEGFEFETMKKGAINCKCLHWARFVSDRLT